MQKEASQKNINIRHLKKRIKQEKMQNNTKKVMTTLKHTKEQKAKYVIVKWQKTTYNNIGQKETIYSIVNNTKQYQTLRHRTRQEKKHIKI